MQELLGVALATLVSSFVGFFLASYLKQKGENLATHEDINKLVDQVRAVTQTTKEIEAKISEDVAHRQRTWELKRDVLFEAVKQLAEIKDRLIGLKTAFHLRAEAKDPSSWNQPVHLATQDWRAASERYQQTEILVSVTCGDKLDEHFRSLGALVRSIAKSIVKEDFQLYETAGPAVEKASQLITEAIRKELGV